MKSIFKIYLIWSVVLVIHGSWIVLTGEFGEKAGEEIFRSFLIMFYIGFLLFLALGAFLAWYAQQGKPWALWLFSVYCLLRAIDTIWGINMREGMEHVTVDISDWIRSLIIAFGWASFIGFAWYIRPNKVTQPMKKNGATEL